MKKIYRMFYVVVIYTLAVPLASLGFIGAFLYDVFMAVKKRDTWYLNVGPKAFLEGVKEGHKINMHWVKTGNHYGTFSIPEEEEA